MAKYIKREMPDMSHEGKTKAYYRMKVQRNICTQELVRLTGLSRTTATLELQ